MSDSKSEQRRKRYRRYRTLARSLHARLFRSADGRLFLVSCKPDFEKLLQCLSRFTNVPPMERSPAASDLGLICNGEVTNYSLHTISHALTKWSRALDNEVSWRPQNRKRRQQLLREREEILHLQGRLAFAYRGKNENSPYLLDTEKETILETHLIEAQRDHMLPSLSRWFARLVIWIAGPHALARFLNSLRPLLEAGVDFRHIEQLQGFQQQLRVFKKRSQWERPKSLRFELRERIRSLPNRIALLGNFSSRCDSGAFAEHCDSMINVCDNLLVALKAMPLRRIPAAYAAWAVCDGATAALPTRFAEDCLRTSDYRTLKQQVKTLINESGKQGYDGLLVTLAGLPETPETQAFQHIRAAVAKGASHADVEWAMSEGVLPQFTHLAATPAWARCLQQQFNGFGIKLRGDSLLNLLESLHQRKDITAIDRVVRWLEIPSRDTFTPRITKLVKSAIFDLILPNLSQLQCHDRIHSWANAADKSCASQQKIDGMKPEVNKWLNRIANYQSQVKSETKAPKSIRKLVERLDKIQRERDFLRHCSTSGEFSTKQKARLQYLESQDRAVEVNESHVIRAAEEVFVITALEALRSLIRRAAEQAWSAELRVPLRKVSFKQLLGFAAWLNAMENEQRAMLQQILDAWRAVGTGYKAKISANQSWLAKTELRGVDLAAWLQARGKSKYVDGRQVRISVVHDPIETFLMGSYFGTCLSLGQMNEMSVLANAHDANKQVIYMVDQRGVVLARQIVAISEEFKLLGYHCYTTIDRHDPGRRDRYIAAMADYCGDLARRCNLHLSGDGEPESLGDHFWYDDGVWDWHQAAKIAWKAENLKLCTVARFDQRANLNSLSMMA